MTEWNQFKGGPQHSGLRRELEGPVRIEESWTADLAGPVGSPVLDRDTVYVGTSRGNCYAFDRERGDQRWVFETAAATDATPVVTRDRLYLGTGDGTVHAFDPATGQREWQTDLPGALESSLALSSGRLYAGHADGLSALEAETGAELWHRETETAVVGCPAVADGRDRRRDRRRTDADPDRAPDPADLGQIRMEAEREGSSDRDWNRERVFLATERGTVMALEAETGEEAWTAPTDGAVTAGPTVADGRVYVGDDEGTLVAMDGATGQSWFTYEIDAAFTSSATVLAAAETTFVGASDGYLHVTDTTFGRRKRRGWLFSKRGVAVDGPVRSCPIVAGDVLCVGDASGSLYGIDVDDFDPLWHFAIDDAVAGTPAPADERLYVGSDSGRFYCLEWTAGQLRP